MSSEAITRNDLLTILGSVTHGAPSTYKKLLWNNPNPFSPFGSQQVVSNVDLTQYDEIEFYYAANNGYPYCMETARQLVGTESYIFAGSNALNARYTNVTTTSISFGDGIRYSYAGNGITDNYQLIPQKIYGIIYDYVQPPTKESVLEVDCGMIEHKNFNAVTVAGQSSTYKQISFNRTFSSIPKVVVQQHNQNLGSYGSVATSVNNVTTTGFNLYVHAVPTTTLEKLYYDWIAIVSEY